jgi:hypothetical protein
MSSNSQSPSYQAPGQFYTGPAKQSWNPKAKMASSLKGLLSRFTPNASSSNLVGFTKAKTASDLFTVTDPTVDGDECLRDCESCSVHLPRGFKIDETEELYGMVKGWSRHILCATGKTDWVRDVSDEKGSIMEAVGKHAELHEKGVGERSLYGTLI